MKRIYLLLRNNQQTGPFTIGELLQQQVKPSDMIWIEGKSAAWTYLSELELIPFVGPSVPKENPVVKPKDEIERKAEELRKKVLSSPPKSYAPGNVEIETYASGYKLPENEIDFVDHRKEKNTRKNIVAGELLLTCFVVALFGLGIYKGRSFLSERKQENSVAKFVSKDQHAAQKETAPQTSSAFQMDSLQQQDSDSLTAPEVSKPKPSLAAKRPTDSVKNPGSTTSVVPQESTELLITEKKEDHAIVPPLVTAPKETVVKKEESIKKEIASNEVKQVKKPTGDSEEKKKGFLGIFKKKKKNE